MSSKENSGSGGRKKLVAQDYSALFTKMATTIDEKVANKQTEEEAIVTADEDGQIDMAAMMGFAGFGKKGEDKELKKKQQAEMIASTKRTPVVQEDDNSATERSTNPFDAIVDKSVDKASDDDADDDDDEGGYEAQDSLGIPVSHEVTLKHGERPISAMDIDPSGARVVTGSFDYKVKLWDFAAMDARMRSFREVQPYEGVQVRKLLFNNTGDLIVVCTGNATPKVVDRDGFDVAECLKGDQYFNDLSKTYGHVSIVNDAVWHPTKKNLFITCSADSTVRVWNTDSTQLNNTLKSTICGKCRARNGKRAGIVSLSISPICGKLVVVGCEGGSIQSFSLGDRMMIPKQQHHGAHAEGTDVTCLRFSRDGRLLSRSTDGTVKLWNAKKLTQGPTHTQGDLPCYYSMTECVFSPDEKYVLTGLSGPEVAGVLVLLDGHNLTPVRRFGLAGMGIGVIRIKWHPRINQILCSLSKGHTKVLFDNDKSFRGAKFCVSKAPRKANALDAVGVESFGSVEGAIVAPNTLLAFRTEEDEQKQRRTTKRQREKARKDTKKTMMPEKPMPSDTKEFGLGYQGQVRNYPTSLNQFLATKTSYDKTRDEDPREAILKHAEEAARNPMFVDTAYKMFNNRVDPIFNEDYDSDDEEHQGTLHKQRKFDPEKKPFQVKSRDVGVDGNLKD